MEEKLEMLCSALVKGLQCTEFIPRAVRTLIYRKPRDFMCLNKSHTTEKIPLINAKWNIAKDVPRNVVFWFVFETNRGAK